MFMSKREKNVLYLEEKNELCTFILYTYRRYLLMYKTLISVRIKTDQPVAIVYTYCMGRWCVQMRVERK